MILRIIWEFSCQAKKNSEIFDAGPGHQTSTDDESDGFNCSMMEIPSIGLHLSLVT